MATIAELVDAIDGFMDNRATVRDILIGQIKGTTRQIRIKNNNLQRDLREVRRARIQLQTDLGREQRRRYDAEAERDNEIIRRQNAEGAMGNVIGDLHLLQTNGQNQGKNWRCNNLSDNLGVATLTAVRGLAAGNGGGQIGALNTAGEFQGKAAAEIGRIGAGIATGADIIPNGTWDEDWSIAGGEPVDNAPVAPNAGGGLPVVTIAPGIKLGQLLYLFRTAYTTVEHLKQTAVFGQLMQGDMSVEQFSARIKKQREQFIRGLNPMNQYNIQMMAKFYDTRDNITKALAKAEKFTLSQKSAPSSLPIFLIANPYADTNRSGGGMTKNEIEDLPYKKYVYGFYTVYTYF
ncbi:hypothetical protein RhiirB3_394802 [Rhizophagus irregularis]|nr:hypothetical protein RhiirB3_394802 [Rhizophagus irregularis]